MIDAVNTVGGVFRICKCCPANSCRLLSTIHFMHCSDVPSSVSECLFFPPYHLLVSFHSIVVWELSMLRLAIASCMELSYAISAVCSLERMPVFRRTCSQIIALARVKCLAAISQHHLPPFSNFSRPSTAFTESFHCASESTSDL